jgi:hypothetical protein
MSIKLNGATSGSVDIDVPAVVGGDVSLELPGGGTVDRLERAGNVIQVVQVQDGAYTTGTGTMPLTSIPQNTNGTEFMSLAITPTSATSKLMINVNALVSCSIGSIYIVGALFQDSTADALAAWEAYPTGAAAPVGLNFTHYMTAGTTSATTFKFRAGATSAATTNFNGGSSTGHGGGVMASSIIITEIAA